MRKFIAGLLVGALLMSGLPVFAETTQTINAIFGRVKLMVDGKPVDKETLLYNGTTYVPLRAAAEALGKEVSYDQVTATAYINTVGTNRTVEEPKADTQTQNETQIKYYAENKSRAQINF